MKPASRATLLPIFLQWPARLRCVAHPPLHPMVPRSSLIQLQSASTACPLERLSALDIATNPDHLLLYANLALSYAYSVCLTRYNINNRELHNVPRQFCINLHPLALDHVRRFYPFVENPGVLDIFTRQAFTGLFRFTLPLRYERAIKQWMDAPLRCISHVSQTDQ